MKKTFRFPLLIVRSGCLSFPRLLALGLVLLAANLWIIIEFLYFKADRMSKVKSARIYAASVGKPVLNYGCMETDFGDVNADIVPQDVPHFALIEPSPTLLPYPDKFFGAAICLHVREHVPDPKALKDLLSRVADRVYEALPHPIFVFSWLFPEHLWVFIRGRAYRIRRWAPNILARDLTL